MGRCRLRRPLLRPTVPLVEKQSNANVVLLFVAATRARRDVKVLVSGDPTPLLPAAAGT